MQLISAVIVVIALAMPIFKENMAMRNIGKKNNWNNYRKNKDVDEIVEDKMTRINVTESGGGEYA